MASDPTYSDEKAAREAGSLLLTFSLVFAMSGAVNSRKFKKQVINRGAWLTGIFLQFVILPCVGFALVHALDLEFHSGITLIALTSSPGGVYSNWCSSIFNADLALSISMTAISTVIGLIMLPCNLVLYISNAYSDDVLKSIRWDYLFPSIISVILAILSGLFCSSRMNSTQSNLFFNRMGNFSAFSLALFTFLVLQFDRRLEIDMWGQSWKFYLGLASPSVIGLVLATLCSTWFQLPKPERVTVAIECFCQNNAIAITLVLGMFDFDSAILSEVLVIPLYITLVNVILLGVCFILAWKGGWTRAPKDANIFVVLTKAYEIWENDVIDKNHQMEKKSSAGVTIVANETFIQESFEDGSVEEGFVLTNTQKKIAFDPDKSDSDIFEDNIHLGPDGNIHTFSNEIQNDTNLGVSTVSPTLIMSPDNAQNTAMRRNSFKKGRRSSRTSIAAKTLIIEETINEDSIAEDPDISVAGESDLESGLSVSRHGSEICLLGIPTNRPFSRDALSLNHSANNSTTKESTEHLYSKDPTLPKVKPSTPARANPMAVLNENNSYSSANDMPLITDKDDNSSSNNISQPSTIEITSSTSSQYNSPQFKPTKSTPFSVNKGDFDSPVASNISDSSNVDSDLSDMKRPLSDENNAQPSTNDSDLENDETGSHITNSTTEPKISMSSNSSPSSSSACGPSSVEKTCNETASTTTTDDGFLKEREDNILGSQTNMTSTKDETEQSIRSEKKSTIEIDEHSINSRTESSD